MSLGLRRSFVLLFVPAFLGACGDIHMGLPGTGDSGPDNSKAQTRPECPNLSGKYEFDQPGTGLRRKLVEIIQDQCKSLTAKWTFVAASGISSEDSKSYVMDGSCRHFTPSVPSACVRDRYDGTKMISELFNDDRKLEATQIYMQDAQTLIFESISYQSGGTSTVSRESARSLLN